ncbi:disease resistance protein TAO1 [Raphanus sativus]|uniref:ADP-ribosyl cyclase/cyclic ADP-ribose hydrolase n=1 Tax=Raphanus sativus TaxID=3726 RepID=A0A6J0LH30_RAPSA|nr:disease resistance protein TAO1 [Raphanus sativus]
MQNFHKSSLWFIIALHILCRNIFGPSLHHTDCFFLFYHFLYPSSCFLKKFRFHQENQDLTFLFINFSKKKKRKSFLKMRFQSFLKEMKKQRRKTEKRKKRKGDELSNPARKKIRLPSSPQSSLSPSSPQSSVSPSSLPSSLSPLSHPSSLSLPSVPSSSSHNCAHDVFPSFRGEDVRVGFLSHIQKEFKRKGIKPFIDNNINRGESIGPELKRAIRGSKIAIILLSKNYAFSKWCLDELVEIMKCKEELGQTVIPVFYKVDPSDVKKLRGYFGKVFEKTCEGKSKQDTDKWRHALVKVATVAGYDSSTWNNEAAMIEEIATDVSNKLISSVPSSDFDSLVGMRAHMESMELLLRLDSDEVRMIGIWGPSGIGKSTIARFLFSQHSGDFQLSVYMENIKREYPRPCFDRYSAQLQLQNKFLSLILNQKDITIHHLGVAQDRLKDKKVLVVLDDVDHSAQLDALAKELTWFGSGSRIIVTTQDKRILNAHRIDHIYEVGFPHDDEALEIFCLNAFGQKSPYDGFEGLAREVTYLAGKLPLGLSVMGSYFKGLSKEEWDNDLPRLRTRLNGDIENTLKFSYDVLCDEEQALFLHIACFFNGELMEKVEEHLAEKFFAVKSHLRVLAEKSLLSVNSKGYIWMHNLLARLGMEIVRKQSPNEPGQRQFLVDDGDVRQVLRDDTLGIRSVIGINSLNYKPGDELKINEGAFERMSNVQFLRLRSYIPDSLYLRASSSYILESLNCLPREVRVLHWQYFPMTCLPSNFNPEFLVEIKMSHSNLQKLWEGNKTIRNLKWVDLSYSKNLEELPNLSTATNLRELDLSYCSSLVELPFSIGNLSNLMNLDLNGCLSLVELPSSIGNMANLNKLCLGSSSLVELPSSIGKMTNLEKLDLNGCLSLVELPSSIGNLHNLQKLSLLCCSKLKALPININMKSLDELDLTYCSSLKSSPEISTNIRVVKIIGTAIQELPPSIKSWSRLERLCMPYCENLGRSRHVFDRIRELHLTDTGKQEIDQCVKEMSCLEKLEIKGFSNLVELPSYIGNLTNLKILFLVECSSLVEIPSSIGNMTNLGWLSLNCSSLVEIPSSIENMTNLKRLCLSKCSSLVEIPSSIGNMTNLEWLFLLNCSSLVEIPSSIENMTNLKSLSLGKCSSLVEIPSSIGNMTNLKSLSLVECSSLVELPAFIGKMTNLDELDLSGCLSLVELPSSIWNLTNLENLYLRGCSKLTTLLPMNINMKSLYSLNLTDCSWLKRFPEISTNIRVLDLQGTAVEEIPPSIRSWSRLNRLSMLYSENLRKSQHAFDLITELHLSNTGIQEIAPWVKEMSRLRTLVINGCTKLVSLPQLPDSLACIDAKNCESLERLDCSFYKTEFSVLSFVNCFKLNEEARDLILMTSTELWAVFPGEKVPTYFSYRATGSSVSMKLNELDTRFPTFLRFKACLLLVTRPSAVESDIWWSSEISYCINDKVRHVSDYSESDYRWYPLCPPRSEHLVVIEFEEAVSSPELFFEFRFKNKNREIKECGLRPLETSARWC